MNVAWRKKNLKKNSASSPKNAVTPRSVVASRRSVMPETSSKQKCDDELAVLHERKQVDAIGKLATMSSDVTFVPHPPTAAGIPPMMRLHAVHLPTKIAAIPAIAVPILALILVTTRAKLLLARPPTRIAAGTIDDRDVRLERRKPC